MYCICCKENNVVPIDLVADLDDGIDTILSEVEMLWEQKQVSMPDGGTRSQSINNAMVNNGIIHIIDAGYGSIHDGDKIIIGICDKCISKNLEDATLLYYGNYMFDGKHIEDEVDKSKKLYNRRKNLDDLTN